MESTEATIVPADRRNEHNRIGSTTATDNSTRTPVESSRNSTQSESKPAVVGRSDKNSTDKRHRQGEAKASNRTNAYSSSSDNENASEGSGALDSSDSNSDSEEEQVKTKSSVRKKHVKVPKSKSKSKEPSSSNKKVPKTQAKKGRKSKKNKAKLINVDSDPDSSSDDESVDSTDEEMNDTNNVASVQSELKDEFQALKLQITQLQQQLSHQNTSSLYPPGLGYQYHYPAAQSPHSIQAMLPPSIPPPVTSSRNRGRGVLPPNVRLQRHNSLSGLADEEKDPLDGSKKRKASSGLDFKRVDWVWDNKIHNYTLQDTTESAGDSQYNDFIFHVRRTFDWEGKYRATLVDIKSKLLRECLQDVMGDVTGVSLVDETPKVDPHLLFL